MSTKPATDHSKPGKLEIRFSAFEALVASKAEEQRKLDLITAATWLDIEGFMKLGQVHVVNPVETLQFGTDATIIIRAEKDTNGTFYVMTMFDQKQKVLVGREVVVDNECVANAISARTSIVAFALKENPAFLHHAKEHLLKGAAAATHSKNVLESFIKEVKRTPAKRPRV